MAFFNSNEFQKEVFTPHPLPASEDQFDTSNLPGYNLAQTFYGDIC